MALERYCLLIILMSYLFMCVRSEMCPKQCDCDLDKGLNRAMCVDQNIIGIDVGVPNIVQVYWLSHNVISELDNYCFKDVGYTSIQELNLSYNLIFWIGLHAFAGLKQLSHLDLSYNRLRFIPPDLLWDTQELESLDLSGNIFEDLKNEPFLIHSKLQVLNLNNCRIGSLPERLFTRLPYLKKLDLSENYMVSLNTGLLKPLRRLKRLELRNDFWQCNKEFIAVENWIISKEITYEKQCNKKMPKMFEKMISAVTTEKQQVDIEKVWNITINNDNESLPVLEPTKPQTPIEKIDKGFSTFQAFVIGLEVGLAVGIVATYIWLRSICKCSALNCVRPRSRRQRSNVQRLTDAEMSCNLLWSTVIYPDLETPPSFRRGLSLPEGRPPFHVDAIRLPDRSETPPPPYNDCRLNT